MFAVCGLLMFFGFDCWIGIVVNSGVGGVWGWCALSDRWVV